MGFCECGQPAIDGKKACMECDRLSKSHKHYSIAKPKPKIIGTTTIKWKLDSNDWRTKDFVLAGSPTTPKNDS